MWHRGINTAFGVMGRVLSKVRDRLPMAFGVQVVNARTASSSCPGSPFSHSALDHLSLTTITAKPPKLNGKYILRTL